ncbi:acyl-CoA dehydratase activase [Thermosulfurimonas marina]|uniref:acyl-CoA dehydratase activase n=1 Tax=Thermosulfurimonas marina TaxID=2047767 RepID=UPI00144A6E49
MKVVGLDVGSRTVKIVVLEEGRVVEAHREETTARLPEQLRALLSGLEFERLVATGYGRNLARELFGAETLTEIRAHALGVKHLFPEVRSILDIGGQDSKALRLDDSGRVVKFEMNDRCAAGTGRFLEVMAAALGVSLAELAQWALSADQGVNLSALCTVFAESEVVGLIGRGEAPERLARGIVTAIVKRALGLLKRVGAEAPLVFTGGVALNQAVVKGLEEALGFAVLVPEAPQMTGALGAALYGAEERIVGQASGGSPPATARPKASASDRAEGCSLMAPRFSTPR